MRSFPAATLILVVGLVVSPRGVFAQNGDIDEIPPMVAPTSPQERFTTTRKQRSEDDDGNPATSDAANSEILTPGGNVNGVPDQPVRKAPTKNQKGSGTAVVATDGAIVYDKPDQDANVIAMLPQGKKVQVSRGVTKGPIPFHKIRVGQKIGYIADIDIMTADAAAAQAAEKKKKSVKKDKNGKPIAKKKPERPRKREEMMFTKFAGLLFGESQYKEGISNVDASTTLPIYGLKITGPDVIVKGPLTDFTIALHYGAPSYYGPLSYNTPSGYLVFTDWLLLVPIIHNFDSMLYVELGPLLVYSNFNVFNAGHQQTLTQFNLGVSALVGYGYRVDEWAFKIEGKYMMEKQYYGAIQLAVQTGF